MNKETPACRTCGFMQLTGRAKITGNNSHLKGPRGDCMCGHRKARYIFEKVCPRSPRMAGFIGYTAPGGKLPQIKTCPKWCPLRPENQRGGAHG